MSDHRAEYERILSALSASDSALVEALDARAKAVLALKALKAADPSRRYDLPRMDEVLERGASQARAMPAELTAPVLREVASVAQAMLAPQRILFHGLEGGLSHEASRRLFGAAAELVPVETAQGVLDELVRGRGTHGVLVFETSTDGAVTATIQGLVDSDEVRIVGEVTTPVRYDLFSKTGNGADVEKCYGASHVIASCERYLRTHYPRAVLMDVPSTAMGAQFTEQDHGAAVVGPSFLGEQHELQAIQTRVQDERDAQIRFAVVGTREPARTGRDRTIVALAVQDEPGALYASLQPFADRNVNLTRLESRPSRGTPWKYVFFVELDGHITDRPVMTAVEQLRARTRFVRVLGSYPRPE